MQSPGSSGGIGGGGISVRGRSDGTEIVGNIISDNSWSVGGGITLFAAGSTTVQGNVISRNVAFNEGGGIDVEATRGFGAQFFVLISEFHGFRDAVTLSLCQNLLISAAVLPSQASGAMSHTWA